MRKYKPIKCAECGKHCKPTNNTQKWCVTCRIKNRSKVTIKQCVICGGAFRALRTAKTCSLECSKEKTRRIGHRHYLARKPPPCIIEKECIVCGKEFTARGKSASRRVSCSPKCSTNRKHLQDRRRRVLYSYARELLKQTGVEL